MSFCIIKTEMSSESCSYVDNKVHSIHTVSDEHAPQYVSSQTYFTPRQEVFVSEVKPHQVEHPTVCFGGKKYQALTTK